MSESGRGRGPGAAPARDDEAQAAARWHRTRAQCFVYSETVPLPAAIAILGLPGVGKTRLACGLAAALLDRGEAALVVHTDVLKVTARMLDAQAAEALRGPGFSGDLAAKAARVHPILAAHVVKARRDGSSVVI